MKQQIIRVKENLKYYREKHHIKQYVQIHNILEYLNSMSKPNATVNENMLQSDDTDVSDLSYQSSCDLDSEQDTLATKQVQHFKQQMNRFFFNHPELQNTNIIEGQGKDKHPNFMRGDLWGSIADDIIQQAKNNTHMPGLKTFSKRLNMYRAKVEKTEVVDLILQEHVRLIKEIDAEIQRKQANQKIIDSTLHAKLKKETGDVNYYSWRKSKQLEFRIDKAKQKAKDYKKQQTNKPLEKEFQILNKMNPRTEPVKGLVEDLKKCPDSLTMKKVLINFLVKYRQQTDREFMNKPSLLQQSQKYYTQETKQFVLLYPNYQIKKKLAAEGITRQKLERGQVNQQSGVCKNKFDLLKGLKSMANGTLMAYWKSAQEKKL